ncbi:MAG: NADH-quinone oxidoreductase subunit NuoN [Zoogloeaceae bacterium]|jgi:NADH-quinone oxidoreductase subunit N|nr:NADH-quinone oxidoreductase subunit NuoN [Zoogloeaceae bacterium]
MFENFVVPNLWPAVPEIFLLFMAGLILLVDLGVRSPRRGATFLLTYATLALSALLTLWYAAAALMPPAPGELARVVLTFHNMFIADLLGSFLKALVCLAVLASLVYSRRYLEERDSIPRGEYCVLTLFATLGMLVMISANHFLSLYLGLELLSLSLCALTALQRDNAVAGEAAMKYFVLGALASGMLLYGMSMIYGATGSLEITEVAERVRSMQRMQMDRTVLVFGLVFLVAGLAFKLGVVPFHMWLPDVYHGAPTSVTLLIAAAPKLAALAMLIRLLVGGLLPLFADWQSMLMLLAVLSMGLGNFVAIAQRNIKRMLAWSAIAHMGFMLLGLASGVGRHSNPQTVLGAYAASLFYIVTYVLATLAIFGLILLLSRRGFESDELEDFRGLNQRSRWFAAMMLILMLSLAGIPFFVGFVAKFAVLEAVVFSGHYWLAVLAVFFSLVGAFFYLRVIWIMYFDEAAENAAPIEASFADKTLLSVNSILVAAIGIFPQFLLGACGYVLARSFEGWRQIVKIYFLPVQSAKKGKQSLPFFGVKAWETHYRPSIRS